jgi:predicted nucleotidyltransferase
VPDPNLEQLIDAARRLRPLLDELVFVGGAVTGLLVTDKAASAPRVTFDVDAIVEVASYAEYAKFGDRLRSLGFSEDARAGAPVCRWVMRGTTLDVMPLDEKVLGFSNRWYRAALETAVQRRLADDLQIWMVTAPLFLATKIEAFKSRGNGDFSASHDLEDLISVVDGRKEIVEEVRAATSELRAYIAAEIDVLLSARAFLDALPGYLHPDAISQRRIGRIRERLRTLAAR